MADGPLAITAKSVYIHGYSVDTAEIPTAVRGHPNAAGTAIRTAADAAKLGVPISRGIPTGLACLPPDPMLRCR